MDRLFVVLLAAALLLGSASMIAREEPTTPVFFSLLFPQLMPDVPMEEQEDAMDWAALFFNLFDGKSSAGRAVAL